MRDWRRDEAPVSVARGDSARRAWRRPPRSAPRGAIKRNRRALPGSALDVEPATEQRQPFADAEQTPSALAGLRSFDEPRRVEPDPLVRHGDAERVILIECQIDRDPIDLARA